MNHGTGTPSRAKRSFIASLSVASTAVSGVGPGSPNASATPATVCGTSDATQITPSSPSAARRRDGARHVVGAHDEPLVGQQHPRRVGRSVAHRHAQPHLLGARDRRHRLDPAGDEQQRAGHSPSGHMRSRRWPASSIGTMSSSGSTAQCTSAAPGAASASVSAGTSAVAVGDAPARDPVGARDRGEVGVPLLPAGRIRAPVEELELGDDAEPVVVDHHDLDRQLLVDDRRELLDVDLQRPVADEADDVAALERGADCGRQVVAHRAVPAGGEQRAAREVDVEVPRDPLLVQADAGDDHEIAPARELVGGDDHLLRLERPVGDDRQRVLAPPRRDLLVPRREVRPGRPTAPAARRAPSRASPKTAMSVRTREWSSSAGSASTRTIVAPGANVGDLAAGLADVEPRADDEHDVGVLDRQARVLVAGVAVEAERQRVVAGQRAEPQQAVRDRDAALARRAGAAPRSRLPAARPGPR